MILKIKQNDSWRLIDNVRDVVIPDCENEDGSIIISYEINNETILQKVKEGCYVLNDSGKTIEKVC